MGLVNTSVGNLTFRRRDIVTGAQGPVTFARVHDSRIAEDADFGPGWRLSLAEELFVDGDDATYVDASGARHRFAWTGTAWTASPPTPRHARTTLTFVESNGVRTAVLAGGEEVRSFVPADVDGVRHVLRTVRTPARELVLDYAGGRLSAVAHDGTVLFAVDRDSEGRIAEVRDDHGRRVRYAYDRDGRLGTVRDIAGGEWRHAYGADGRLAALSGPEGRTHLLAAYDDAGRAVQAFGDELVAYAYGDGATTATDIEMGTVHGLARNAAGVTTAYESTTGVSWRVTLDAANRVAELALPGRTLAYAYDAGGRLASTTTADEAVGLTTAEHYVYDAAGRLTGVTGAGRHVSVTYASGHVRIDDGAASLSYDLDEQGRVTSVRQGTDMAVRAERDGVGDIVALSRGRATVRFGRDPLGRIVEAVFADGSSARYFHDDLGNRSLAEHGDGRVVEYSHDAVGNLTGVETRQRDGTVQLVTVSVPDLAERTTLASAPSDHDETSSRDDARAVLLGNSALDGQPDYGVLAFGRDLGGERRKLLESAVPHAAKAQRLLSVATPLLLPNAVGQLDVPVAQVSYHAGRREGAAACESGNEPMTPEQWAAHHGIEIKAGVTIGDITDEMVATFDDIARAWETHAPGVTPVITSGTDGQHRPALYTIRVERLTCVRAISRLRR